MLYYLHFIPYHFRDILNVDVKQIEFTINLDMNPVNCWKRHVDYCVIPKTILESSVCNICEYSAKKLYILDVIFQRVLALMNQQLHQGLGTWPPVLRKDWNNLCIYVFVLQHFCVHYWGTIFLFPQSLNTWVVWICLPFMAYWDIKHYMLKALLFAMS